MTIVGHAIFLYTYDSLKHDVSTPIASLLSRLVTMVFVQPLDCMRTYSQANLYGNKVPSFKEVAKSKGFFSLYKGSYPTLIRDIPFSTFHWPINEFLYKKITGMERFRERELTQMESMYIPFISGTFSSIIATIFSQPFDIIKTNIQAAGLDHRCLKKSTVLSEFRRLNKNYGMRGFFIGIGPRMFKVVPGSAIMSATYYYYNK
ncbi:mitochondrial carrier protein, putative [Theileria equi strain WA]|uniref:Mitochondrial carrier protein, putative n=1 Tax=Theileria equi strain WA TaxID=1537102 RepID=L0B287_THEEQ|nr:mitochondrial carrier protein, putative [Theileria equi strain WA]AFZ81351.1 mitochondrial carrier protein, putative [Theileria equi strain WA]|eukprot:XP_004831017.1 mitochondrial carrier protein, putative [Theileria equi strain WA]